MNQPTVTIRRATVEDAQMLSKFGAELFEATFRGTCPDEDMHQQLADYYNVNQVTAELSDPEDFFHLLSHDTTICGYSRLKKGNPPAEVIGSTQAIELKRLYFAQQAHGKGLAAKLMEFNLELARKMQYQRVYLSVWEHNERAKAFYRKLGFADTGVGNPFPIGETPQMDYWYTLDL